MHSNDDAGFSVRVNRELRDQAVEVLRQWQVENRAVMEAIFETLKQRPGVLFDVLDPDWPADKGRPEKPRGRPRRTDQKEQQ
jgi:hypothetical protein